MEFLTRDALLILIFLIPGYLGFNTFVLFMVVFFRAFKYRWENLSYLTIIVVSILWSSLTFTFFNISSYNELIDNLSVKNMFLSIIIAVAIAEIISFSILATLLFSHITISIVRFIFYYKPEGKNYKYFSPKRLKAIFKNFPFDDFFSDLRYKEIIRAWRDTKKITLILKDGRTVSGVIEKNKDTKYKLRELRVKDKSIIHIVSLKDILYVSAHT